MTIDRSHTRRRPLTRVSRAVFPAARKDSEPASPEARTAAEQSVENPPSIAAAPCVPPPRWKIDHTPPSAQAGIVHRSNRPLTEPSLPPVDIRSAPSDPRTTGVFTDSTRCRTSPDETGVHRMLSLSLLRRTTRIRLHLTPFKFLTGHSPLWCHTPSKPPTYEHR